MIRLLFYDAAGKFSLAEFSDRNTPPYATLSHTWSSNEEDECTKKDIEEGTWARKAGSVKVQFSMKQASTDGLKYVWIDTCCINRESSAELSEAINSMFKWYQSAARCYVYLSDVSSTRQRSFQTQDCCHSDELHHLKKWKTALQSSRWFTRGWTLQELLAPKTVVFFSQDGTCLGHKQELLEEINQITGVPTEALRGGGRALGNFSVGDRLQWMHNRETKREEDIVYSLLGIFDVSLAPIYGEGREKARRRLMREVEDLQKAASDATDEGPCPYTSEGRESEARKRSLAPPQIDRQIPQRDREHHKSSSTAHCQTSYRNYSGAQNNNTGSGNMFLGDLTGPVTFH